MADNPIVVSSSAASAQVMGVLRDLLKVIGVSLVAKGYMDAAYVEPLIGFFMVLGPIIWSQWVIISKHDKYVNAADAAPNDRFIVK